MCFRQISIVSFWQCLLPKIAKYYAKTDPQNLLLNEHQNSVLLQWARAHTLTTEISMPN